MISRKHVMTMLVLGLLCGVLLASCQAPATTAAPASADKPADTQAAPTALPTATLPPSATPLPPTETPVPPTATPVPTDTPVPTPTPGIGSTRVSEKDGMVMAYIPPGALQVGEDQTVDLQGFWMDTTEVTNAMFKECVRQGGCPETWFDPEENYYDPQYANHPVPGYYPKEYCLWAGRRLPADAEWLYAAQGGLVGKLYPWGDEEPVCEPGQPNSAHGPKCDPAQYDSVPVASFAPNGYGLYDMDGNAAEQTWSGSRLGLPITGYETWQTLAPSGFRCVVSDNPPLAALPTPGPVSPVDGMTLALIPAGSFQMGFDQENTDKNWAAPIHKVTLDAFWMDATEVTNAMYTQCIAAGACTPPRDEENIRSMFGHPMLDDFPVTSVTWDQAVEYCTWTGRRLPTEAEWEYAARGGLEGKPYPWGDTEPCSEGAQNDPQVAQFNGCIVGGSVARYAPNAYGLYDMFGNAMEWVADWFKGGYEAGDATNPTGPETGSERVKRWNRLPIYLRSAGIPDSSDGDTGFRCALSYDPANPPDKAAAPTLAAPTGAALPAPAAPTVETRLSKPSGMTQAFIPAGTFDMGSASGSPNAQPVQTVTLKAFWMDTTEVTNAMFDQCILQGGCTFSRQRWSHTRFDYNYDPAVVGGVFYYPLEHFGHITPPNPAYVNFPVINVSWEQANKYCAWAKGRLPTEAEWEYAARGGLVGKLYPWGDESPACTPGAGNGAQFSGCTPADTVAVASFAPNGYGLYDMAGNVMEWTASIFMPYPYDPADGRDKLTGTSYRVLRGGSWLNPLELLTVSARYNSWQRSQSNNFIGFRCVSDK